MQSFMQGKLVVQLMVLAGSLFAIYWFMWRPVMARKESYGEFFKALDDVNATAGFKFRMLFRGLKTEIWANFLIIVPVILYLLEQVEAVPNLFSMPFMPEWLQSSGVMVITFIGFVTRYLNSVRTTPVGSPLPDAPTAVEVPTADGLPNAIIVASASGGVASVRKMGEEDPVPIVVAPAEPIPPAPAALKKIKRKPRKKIRKKKSKKKKRGR